MPKATVTVRELKNKETGIDLSVTSYKEIPGLVRSSFEYQIVVVSTLSCFKLPSHKESDVVQFTLFKKFPDFEDLRAKLNEAFSGTALPPLSKKSLIVNEAVIKERRNNLDSFLKFLSATPRVVTCTHVLTFLGVDAQKAKRFSSGESEGSLQQEDGNTEEKEEESQQDGMTSSNLFEDEGDEEEEEGADFLSAASSSARPAVSEDDLFSMSDSRSSTSRDTRLFERQDLKRELTEEDEKDFAFLPDAIITKREVVTVPREDSESDLFHVDEDIDFDKLLSLDTATTRKEPSPPQTQPQPKPSPSKPQPAQKPSVPAKPKPGSKPPVTAAKPSASPKPQDPFSDVASKPAVPDRPKPAPRKLKPAGGGGGGGGGGGSKGEGEGGRGEGSSGAVPEKPDMSSDDIMQYIAANAEGDDADLDLFS